MDCKIHHHNSRVCEKGTKGCGVVHNISKVSSVRVDSMVSHTVRVDDVVSHTEISKEDEIFVNGLLELWPDIRQGTRQDIMKKLGKKKPLVLAEFMFKFVNS